MSATDDRPWRQAMPSDPVFDDFRAPLDLESLRQAVIGAPDRFTREEALMAFEQAIRQDACRA